MISDIIHTVREQKTIVNDMNSKYSRCQCLSLILLIILVVQLLTALFVPSILLYLLTMKSNVS